MWSDIQACNFNDRSRALTQRPLYREDSAFGDPWLVDGLGPTWNDPVHGIQPRATAEALERRTLLSRTDLGPYAVHVSTDQRTSAHWTPSVLGCTAPIYIDADNSGAFESAFDYAKRIVDGSKEELPAVCKALAAYDASVAALTSVVCFSGARP